MAGTAGRESIKEFLMSEKTKFIDYEYEETPGGGKRRKLILGEKCGAVFKSIFLALLLIVFILALVRMQVPTESIAKFLSVLPKF